MTDAETITFCIDARVAGAFRVAEVVFAFLVGLVMWQTEHDRACKSAGRQLHLIRRWGFIATGSTLIFSAAILSIGSLMAVIIVGAFNFAANSAALKERGTPPNDGRHANVMSDRRFAFRPLILFSSLWRKAHH
jgi:hypothetical protein